MAAATIVDSTDGFLARKVRIKEVVPSFDGRRLDDLVDFLNYTFLPLLLIWRAGILPPGQEPWLFLPLLASAYGFCQVQAKTDDGYFLGFPSLWNVVALYLYMLPLGAVAVACRRGRAGDADVCADPPPLSITTGPVQSRGDLLAVPWTSSSSGSSGSCPKGRDTGLSGSTMQWAWVSLRIRCFTWASRGRLALPTLAEATLYADSARDPSRLSSVSVSAKASASSARARRWPPATSTKHKSTPPTAEERDERRGSHFGPTRSRVPRPNIAGPKMPANFSATPKKPKNSPDLSRGIRLAKSDRLKRLRSTLHGADQDREHDEVGRVFMK